MMHSHRKRECTTTRYCVLFIAEIVLRYTVFKVRRHSFAPLSGSGGDNEIRTHDPLLARQVLSQLSYTPMSAKRMPFRR